MKLAAYRVKSKSRVDLGDWDPDDTRAVGEKNGEAKERLAAMSERLEALQELLYAEGRHKLLVVLQAMDTAGKDSTIRHVFQGVDPLGVRVASFKAPTPYELARDYLWRVHQHAPGRGEIGIFNRSHYEDVLIVRVNELVPEDVWRPRFEIIRDGAAIRSIEREAVVGR